MSQKIALAALLLASVPLAGIADDTSSNGADSAVEKKSDDRPKESKRDSSDIRRAKEDRQESYEKHVKKRGKGNRQGGRNPSPDA